METRANYVLIGAAVMIATALGFLSILVLGQGRTSYDRYDVVFRERVSGLTVGSAVGFNGIQRGEVETLTISPADPSVTIARVKIERGTPVRTDTKAELELVGFTGLAIIQFVGGSPGAPMLLETVEDTPVIEADTSGFAAFLEGSGDIIAAANRLLSEENTQTVTQILSNVEALSGAFAAQEENIELALTNTAKLTADMSAVSGRLVRIADSLDALLVDQAPDTMRQAQAALAEAQLLVAELRVIAEENREPLSAFTEQGLGQIGPALAEARRLFRTLDQVLREIDRDPRGYLFGESTPEYETPQ